MRGCIYNKKIYMIVSICMASILFSNCFMNEAFGEIISNTNDNLIKDSIVLSNDKAFTYVGINNNASNIIQILFFILSSTLY